MTALVGPSPSGTDLFLIAGIPRDQLDRAPGSRLEVVGLAFDEDQEPGCSTESSRSTAGMSGTTPAICVFSSPIPAGEYGLPDRLAGACRRTGASAVGSARARVPRRFEDGMRFISALDPESGWGRVALYLGDALSPYAFDLEQRAPMIDAIEGGPRRILTFLPSTVRGFAPTNAVLSARVTNLATGDTRDLPLAVLEQRQQDDTIIYRIELRIENVPVGRYSLYFFSEDGETHQAYSFTARTMIIK